MKRKFHLFFALAVGLLCLSASNSAAQDFRATITGRVTDTNKAAVPNAQVTVKNLGTNETTTATTDSEGNYKAPFLRPGSYSITVEASGFKKATRDKIELVIREMATFDFALEAGAISEQVTIEGNAPVIETASADRGGVIDRQKVIELPLNSRNPFMLGVLTAGVNFNGASIWQRPFDNGAIAEWTINGSQSRGNEFLLDGAPNNGQAGGNNIAYVPPVDAVQDFKIMTNTYDAQYGKTTGGIINVNLKSGTNNLHGTLYEFMRRAPLDATDFRLKARGAPKPEHYLDQYGGMVEGPVRVPWLYNGKDKTFFMFNYEGYREGVPQPLTLSTVQPEFLDGDFSKLVDRTGKQIVIYDPLTGHDAPDPKDSTKTIWVRDPFPGNKIPANRLSPIAKNILGYMPKPNVTDPAADYSKNNFFLSPNLATDAFWNWTAKVDQQFNDKHRMYLRFAKNDRRENRNENGVIDAVGECCQLPFKRLNDAFVADHVANFSPTFIFNFRLSFNRFEEKGVANENMGFDRTTLGFPASLVNALPGSEMFGRYEISDVTNANYTFIGRNPGNNITNTIASHPNITWIRGAQTWRAGVDMRWVQYNTKDEGNPFLITANRGFTQKDFSAGDAGSGNGIASFLLGYVGGRVENNLFPTTLGKYYAPWFQDDWKINRKLTLNLGVRWDINVAPNERYNRLNRGFDPTVVNPADSLIKHTIVDPKGGTITLPQLKGGLNFAGVDGNGRIASDIDWNNIQPRIGFAYLLKEKLVMRGGWGLYYVNPGNDYLQFNGFSVTTDIVNSLDGGRTPIQGILNNPYPNGILTPQGANGGLSTFLGRDNFNFVGPNFVVPYVHQFSLGFQYQLPWDSKLEVSYVGNRTKNLQTTRPFNEPDLAFRQKCFSLEGGNPAFCNEQLPNPFQGIEAFRGTTRFTSPTLSRFELARPYPQFGRITEVARNDGGINYDSAQVTFEKRARNGLNGVITYTYSKQIEQWGWNDVQKGIMQRGYYTWDRPHRFTAGLVYQLPFGDGQKLLNVRNGVLSKIVSGWQSSLILQWQSGRPWDLNENIEWINPDAYLKDIQWKGSDQVWALRSYPVIDPKTGQPTGQRSVCAGVRGNDGKVTLQSYSQNLQGCTTDNVDVIRRGGYPGSAVVPRYTSFRSSTVRLHSPPTADLSFSKSVKITESKRFQFRLEMFNFTNTYSYRVRQFTNDPDNSGFGSVVPRSAGDTEVAYPRHIQLGFKFIF